MNRELRWYANRLQAMSLAELAYRSYRAARYPIEQLLGRTRWYRPSSAMREYLDRWRGPERFYFDRAPGGTSISPELHAEAEAICGGTRRVLGLGRIDFPPDGWHYEPAARGFWPRVDAARVVHAAPAHFDPRLTWELNRGHEWVVLARVYAATREPRFLARLRRDVVSWRQSNPIGVGINWASAMEAAIRVHSLVWCAGLLRDAVGVLPMLGEAIYEHAMVVSDHRSYFSSANNHLIVELSALIVAALALGGDLAPMHAPALARLVRELDRQIFPDGVHAEMATHYHVFVLEALVLVADLQRAHAKPIPELEAVILRMADYLDAIRCGDGSVLQQGDSDDGCILGLRRARHADQVLAAARALSPEPPPQPRSRRFAQSGQIVLRCRRLHAALDAGPFGLGSLAAHAHCDALSITLAVDNRRILVDRGTYRYNGDRDERDHYRLTAAHNTAQIGSLEQATPAGPFLWSRRPTTEIHRCDLSARGGIVQASHDGFPGWVHRRTLVHGHGVLAIIDEFRGAGVDNQVTSRLHFPPELDVVGDSCSGFVAEADGSPLAWVVSSALHARVNKTRHSDQYASCTAASSIELAATCDRPLIVVIGPADVEQDSSIVALARFASEQGIHLPTCELAK